jgi:two-component system, LytTR family, response regulator
MSTYEQGLTNQSEALTNIEGLLGKPQRIAIKASGRILLVDPADIITVEARGNYVLLRRKSGSELLREPMASVAAKLRTCGFIRIHRSVIINTSFVEEIVTSNTGDSLVRIKGGLEFAVSRTYKKNLQSIAPLWIGIGTYALRSA